METLSALLALCAGNHPSQAVESPVICDAMPFMWCHCNDNKIYLRWGHLKYLIFPVVCNYRCLIFNPSMGNAKLKLAHRTVINNSQLYVHIIPYQCPKFNAVLNGISPWQWDTMVRNISGLFCLGLPYVNICMESDVAIEAVDLVRKTPSSNVTSTNTMVSP